MAAPFRVWSTYFGGPGGVGSDDAFLFPDVGPIGSDDFVEDGGSAVAVNPSTGDSYVVGVTNSPTGVAVGGFQSALAGNRDAFIAKIGPTGATQWATYYGGTGGQGIASDDGDLDEALHVAVNPSTGDSYVVGVTNSAAGIASPGAFRTILTGREDAFIAKFDTAGAREWATYFGGSGAGGPGSDDLCEETATGVAVDPSTGDSYVVGYTKSIADIATAGAH